jgi:transposase
MHHSPKTRAGGRRRALWGDAGIDDVSGQPSYVLSALGVRPHAGKYRRLRNGGRLRQSDPGNQTTPRRQRLRHRCARAFLKKRGIKAVIPGKANRKKKIRHDKKAYRGRNVVERCFCRLKDFRRIATRYDKLAQNYFSALCFVATLTYWI